VVLKISIVGDSDEAIEFHLEGKLVGPWVDEVRRLGEQALSHKKLVTLDLKNVLFVDSRGAALLRDFSRRQVSQLNCSQFLLQQMKEVAR
jgi:ABC-type transporter Mla MlaB component